jgi:hypothetical protein
MQALVRPALQLSLLLVLQQASRCLRLKLLPAHMQLQQPPFQPQQQ